MSRKLDKDEKSLLLYLETRAVDCSGSVDTRHMNTSDQKTAAAWHEEWKRRQWKTTKEKRSL